MNTSPQTPPEGSSSGTAAERALRRATTSAPSRARSATPKPRLSGPRSDGRDPKRLADAVDALLIEQGWSTANAVANLTTRWQEVVGADLADHVVPESFTEGRLVLRADSTAWATQVRLLLPQLRAAVDREVGRGVVADISVVGPQAPSWVAGLRRVKGRGPRDTYG